MYNANEFGKSQRVVDTQRKVSNLEKALMVIICVSLAIMLMYVLVTQFDQPSGKMCVSAKSSHSNQQSVTYKPCQY